MDSSFTIRTQHNPHIDKWEIVFVDDSGDSEELSLIACCPNSSISAIFADSLRRYYETFETIDDVAELHKTIIANRITDHRITIQQ